MLKFAAILFVMTVFSGGKSHAQTMQTQQERGQVQTNRPTSEEMALNFSIQHASIAYAYIKCEDTNYNIDDSYRNECIEEMNAIRAEILKEIKDPEKAARESIIIMNSLIQHSEEDTGNGVER